MDQFLANNFVNVLINVTSKNVTTIKKYMMMDHVHVILNVKMIAGIGSCVRIIVKMNAKVLSLMNVQRKN